MRTEINNINNDYSNLLLRLPNECQTIEQVYLTGFLNNSIKLKQSSMVSYFVKVGYVMEALSRQDLSKDNHILSAFIHHIAIDNQEYTYNISKRVLTAFHFDTNIWIKPIIFGGLFLNKNGIESIKNTKACLFISGIKIQGHYNLFFLSIFNLLGLIADLMEKNETEIEEMKGQKVVVTSFKDFQDSAFLEEEQNLDDVDKWTYTYEDGLVAKIKVWLKKYRNEDITVPVFVLAKIWERVEESFNALMLATQPATTDASFLIVKRQIKMFLHSVFIEVRLYQGRDVKSRLNLVKDDDKFYENIKSNDSSIKDLFNFLHECPFFEDYLKETEKVDFKKLSTDEQKKILQSISGWESYAIATIANTLRYYIEPAYKNVSPTQLEQLLNEMKQF
jgi:hypothetical protein